jgi:hypothetical protein
MSASDVHFLQEEINRLKPRVAALLATIKNPESLFDLVCNTTECSLAIKDLQKSIDLRHKQNQNFRGGDEGHRGRVGIEDRALDLLTTAVSDKKAMSEAEAARKAQARLKEIPPGELMDLDKHFPFTPSELKQYELQLKAQRDRLRGKKSKK